MTDQVEAAGGVVVRRGADGVPETLVIHRPRHEDWSLPKGKLESNEDHEEAAVREIEEETGYRCRPGRELPEVRYRDEQGRPKRVRYWVMHPAGDDARSEADDEADVVRWCTFEEARRLLTYDNDRGLLDHVADRDVDAPAAGGEPA